MTQLLAGWSLFSKILNRNAQTSGSAVKEMVLTQDPPSSKVTLREINRETLRAILDLKVSRKQERFVAPNSVSIAEAHFSREA